MVTSVRGAREAEQAEAAPVVKTVSLEQLPFELLFDGLFELLQATRIRPFSMRVC